MREPTAAAIGEVQAAFGADPAAAMCLYKAKSSCGGAHIQVPKNGTSSARIQKRRPLFHANIPSKWWNRLLCVYHFWKKSEKVHFLDRFEPFFFEHEPKNLNAMQKVNLRASD